VAPDHDETADGSERHDRDCDDGQGPVAAPVGGMGQVVQLRDWRGDAGSALDVRREVAPELVLDVHASSFRLMARAASPREV